MTKLRWLLAVVVLPTGRLAAQHASQFEAGAFGSYTRYDAAFGLANKLGGGGRLGYFLGDLVGLEADVVFQPEYTVSSAGTPTTLQPLIGSASVVVNPVHGSRLMLFLLGGYSLLDFGSRAPYHFTDNGMHGGAGVRIFLTERVALRVEGRGIYVPSTKSAFGTKTTATHAVATVGLSVFHLGGPAKDSDKDGVPDKLDACPNTPLGATVDAHGCPTDSDHDGVYDGLDKCPNTPAGATVDANGCPSGADSDGVPDGMGKCPNTPAGPPVAATGCPLPKQVIRDSDGDGVPDDRDKCPNTPPGSKVDANGCIILSQPEAGPAAPGAPRPTLILRGVNFEWGRSALTGSSYAVLDQVAGSLVANPEIRIEIAGYTDNTGAAALNVRLSQARAASVRAYLARKGVAPGRMVAKGYGASGFIAPNTTTAGRGQNRRVGPHKPP